MILALCLISVISTSFICFARESYAGTGTLSKCGACRCCGRTMEPERSAHVVGAGPPQAGLTQETIFGTLFAEIAANSKAQTAAWQTVALAAIQRDRVTPRPEELMIIANEGLAVDVASLERQVFGKAHDGGLIPRVEALEKTLMGQTQQGVLLSRITALRTAV